MPATSVSVNLLDQEELEHSPLGRIVTWAITYGRYIMIGTEVIVLLAFISRFSLDRKLTDINEEIAQKQAIIEANAPFEREIRALQDQLVKMKALLSDQAKIPEILSLMQSALPPDVYLGTLSVNNNKLSASAVAGTTAGFSQFLVNPGNEATYAVKHRRCDKKITLRY